MHSRFTHAEFHGNMLQVEVAGAPVEAISAAWDLACLLLGQADPWRLDKIDYTPAQLGPTHRIQRPDAIMALTFVRVPPVEDVVRVNTITRSVRLPAEAHMAICDPDEGKHAWVLDHPGQARPGLGALCVCGGQEWDVEGIT